MSKRDGEFDPHEAERLRHLRIDLPDAMIEDPLDTRIVGRLLNDAPELVARSLGRFRDAERMRDQRREAWNAWLSLLRERRREICLQRCDDGKASWGELIWWSAAVHWFVFRLSITGIAHFRGWTGIALWAAPNPARLNLLSR